MDKTKGKVLVAMSGGIDSSIAAMLLHEEGYEVIGITMKTWDYATSGGSSKETGCCSLDSINDARALAVQFGFPHFILDIRSEFGDYIIDNFVEEYLAGRTPNPCVLCNTHIKWEALLKRADMLGCAFIATGHYAQVRHENGRYVISKGLDEHKDQSYVLWGLTQESLKRTLFPLGKMRKQEIKALAIERGFVELASKSESYEICFVPDNDYRGFLKRKVVDLEQKVAGGNFVLRNGTVVGKHDGYPFYTIGQRKGLEIALGEPMHVLEIIPETNTVVLGTKDELAEQSMEVRDFNLMKYAELPPHYSALTKIRYKDPGTVADLSVVGDKIVALFHHPVNSIAPGQSAVFYEGNDLVGGGFIARRTSNNAGTRGGFTNKGDGLTNKGGGLTPLITLLVFMLFGISCSKGKQVPAIDLGYGYFPNVAGKYVIYDVDSIVRNSYTFKTDSFHYQLKELIASIYIDNAGKPTQRIERYVKNYGGDTGWVLKNVWTGNLNALNAQRVEGNVRITKLTFPVLLSQSWNGNAYNALPPSTFYYSACNMPMNVNGILLDSTCAVINANDSTFLNKNYGIEIYAKNIGLVYKHLVQLHTDTIRAISLLQNPYATGLVNYTARFNHHN